MTDAKRDAPQYTCAATGAVGLGRATSAGGSAPPHGWKEVAGNWYSRPGFAATFRATVLRFAITTPIAAEGEDEKECKTQFWREIRIAQRDTSRVYNFTTSILFAADTHPAFGEPLGKMPIPDFYGAMRLANPRVATRSLSMAQNDAIRKYRAARLAVIGSMDRSLPSYRRDRSPIRLGWQNAKISFCANGTLVCESRLLSTDMDGARRWGFRLETSGRGVDRQVERLRVALEAQTIRELRIVERAGRGMREDGRRYRRCLLEVVALIARTPSPQKAGVLAVTTTKACLLVAVDQNGREWRLHKNRLRAVLVRHARHVQHDADDYKFERRRSQARRKRLARHYEAQTAKFYARTKCEIQQAAAWVAGLAQRSHLSVCFDDSCRDWCMFMQWSALRAALAQACDSRNIPLAIVSSADEKENDIISEDSGNETTA